MSKDYDIGLSNCFSSLFNITLPIGNGKAAHEC